MNRFFATTIHRHGRAKLVSALSFFICAFMLQPVFAYSIKDDMEALKIYKARPNHNEMAGIVYQQAIDLLVKQQFRKARPLIEEAIRLDPGYAGMYGSYGYCQIWQGNFKEGTESLGRAIGLDSNKPLYFYRRALCFFSTGQMEEAVQELKTLLAKKPDDPDALRLEARCYRGIANKDNEAIACYSQLIKDNVYTLEALCERGKIYAKLDADDKAMGDYQAALKIKPDAGEAFAGMAEIFYKRHQWQAAADNYTAAYVCGTDKALFCERQRGISLEHLQLAKQTGGAKALDKRVR